ncbi:MAG TPA: hypothetical protein VEY09_10940 [Pyrinomonadaceae bacterium]|nr:hypothetical protein [Pyrinomonadaceae bacterium]
MRQYEAVIEAMRAVGGYATLGHLYRTATKIPGCHWGTKTPFASIRRIVQVYPEHFFKIRPGLWGLAAHREALLEKLAAGDSVASPQGHAFTHSFYQGLLVEIGNLKSYDTFVPHQDKNKPFLERKLSDVATVKEFYGFTYDSLLRRAKMIDVSWFNRRKLPKAFFEVEHSTDMLNSLHKFLEFEDFRIKFFVVADSARRREFDGKIASETFASLRQTTKFLDYETLAVWHAKLSESAKAHSFFDL